MDEGSCSYTYDASGHLAFSGARHYTFDSGGRMTCIGEDPPCNRRVLDGRDQAQMGPAMRAVPPGVWSSAVRRNASRRMTAMAGARNAARLQLLPGL